MKLVDKVSVLPVTTTLPVPVERVLNAALVAMPKSVMIIGEGQDGEVYFAASEADGGTALWWMEKAKIALLNMEAS